jgi:RimJ/RimL family protein N-acetyltransferase
MEGLILKGKHVRLEPLDYSHTDGLVAAAAVDPSLYQWSLVPQGKAAVVSYIDTALAWQEAGSALSFAIVRTEDDAIAGSTRFFNIERWAWPKGHLRFGRQYPDACEIGYTWLTSSAIRTAVNTESKLLMLTHAFEVWQMLRVCLHTDARNQRSRAAIERIGGKFEGILRAHRMAADYIARDSARFSIVAEEWADVKRRLTTLVSFVAGTAHNGRSDENHPSVRECRGTDDRTIELDLSSQK